VKMKLSQRSMDLRIGRTFCFEFKERIILMNGQSNDLETIWILIREN